ncbi:prepilin-type N-terminal cleavage/methylation domain-containing protein [Diaphorobacter sp. HDW4B]|uniref:PilW family protein n=1 Tax=Diaphorobacter sp. HDW4B TaxID=2714925 RepID=UPI0014097190|nr:PilW family protein [Diaphorobacter sp. HDW4B]QIL72038.1 prepilin-type N-terminal cleavage/methylation domain-containing protein [Diaphorobacter sp. HDW4B]
MQYPSHSHQRGFSLVELMIAMAISLVIIAGAAYVYLASREGQRSLDRTSGSREAGVFVLQTIGRDLMNAGFYPATILPFEKNDPYYSATQFGMFNGYYPYESSPRAPTDWEDSSTNWPPTAFKSGIFGCDSGPFDTSSSTCTSASGSADTLVINYFTNDTIDAPGTRRDCSGANVDADPSNAERKKNATDDPKLPPRQPLFVSNRYTLISTKMFVDTSDITTKSLACSGNGSNWHSKAAEYQPMVAGVEDMQFTYGIYTSYDPKSTNNTLAPAKFLTATQMASEAPLNVSGIALTAWQRVTAVRVCILTRTLGSNTRVSDMAGTKSTYVDCAGTTTKQPTGYAIARYEQIFGVRNALRLSY